MHHSKTQVRTTGIVYLKALALGIAISACLPVYAGGIEPATAEEAIVNFDIPAGDLSVALEIFSSQSGIQAMYRKDIVARKRTDSLNGLMSPSVALAKLLAGTGLVGERVNERTYVVKALQVNLRGSTGPARMPRSETLDSKKVGEAKEMDRVVVVGSRMGAFPSDSALPVKLITRDEIDRSGASSISQVLSYLPEVSISNEGNTVIGVTGGNLSNQGRNETNSTTVQLRGLPFGNTLILINGRRSGDSSAFVQSGQFDLSTIPLSMVERIEVLPAGSSAVYGGDGLAGVINVVTRADASGLEMRLRRDAAAGYGESQATVMWGKSWSRGSLTTVVSWKKNSRLSAFERSLTADGDFSRFGGRDTRGSTFANPAVVYSLSGCDMSFGFCLLPLDERGNLPGLTAPVAVVPSEQDGTSLSPEDFTNSAGLRGLTSMDYSIVSPERSVSVSTNGTYKVHPEIELIGEFAFSRRSIPARQLLLHVSGGEYGLSSAVVPANNPFNPFGVDVGVDYTYANTGIFREFAQTYWRGLAGARGGFGSGNWDWEVTLWRSEDSSSTGKVFGFNYALLPELLRSSDAAIALNPFVGNGSAPVSEESLSSMLMPMDDDYLSRISGVNGFVRGKLMSLPGGNLMALVGIEYQKSEFSSGFDLGGEDSDGGDESKAVFAEMRLPFVRGEDSDGAEKLAMTAAFRNESTKRFSENADTRVLGVEFRPLRKILFRATHSTAFKPLTIYSSSQPVRVASYAIPVTDPEFNGDVFPVYEMYGGGVPAGLKPETSVSRTVGISITPSSSWRASLTGWKISIDDRLSNADAQFFVDHEGDFPGRVVRGEDGVLRTIDIRQFNIARTTTSGVDLSIDGVFSTQYGDFMPSLAATYVSEYKERVTDLAPEINNLGVIRRTGWTPQWKVVPRMVWRSNDVSATVVGRYVSSYEDPTPLYTGPDEGAYQRLGSFWMIDMNVDFGIRRLGAIGGKRLPDLKVSVGATNIFNRLPDFCNYCGSGYDANQYQIMGRRAYIDLRFEF